MNSTNFVRTRGRPRLFTHAYEVEKQSLYYTSLLCGGRSETARDALENPPGVERKVLLSPVDRVPLELPYGRFPLLA